MANCGLLLTSGDQCLLTSGSYLTLTSTCSTSAIIPIRRVYRTDTDARDLTTLRPSGPRGRETTWWD